MNSDIRIQVSFRNHRKRKRLIRLIGIGADHYLLNLWLAASQTNPDGVLTGWDELDIAEAAEWPKEQEPNALVKALMECGSPGFLEHTDGVYQLHDWSDHQPWVVGAISRSEKAKRAAEARWMLRASKPDATGTKNDARSNAPYPSPSPSPSLRNTSVLLAPPISPKGFDVFWKAYPKKKSKGQAEKAFSKIHPDEQLLATMLAMIEQAKKSEDWQKAGGQYIPHPATWLNAKGWLDEEPPEIPMAEREWPVR